MNAITKGPRDSMLWWRLGTPNDAVPSVLEVARAPVMTSAERHKGWRT